MSSTLASVPYTLAKWALWLIAAGLIGAVVGWLLRGLRPRAAAGLPADIADHLDYLLTRVDELEPAAAERDRLRMELDDCRAAAIAIASAPAPAAPSTPLTVRPVAAPAAVAAVDPEVVAERDRLAARIAGHEATIGDLRARLWNHESKISELQSQLDAQRAAVTPPEPDLEAGAAVLGEKVRFNDLTVVEGIGPKIADVLHTMGVKSWWSLHNTDIALLRSALEAAGPRFQIHDPSTWPQQAGLLALGEWEAFKALTDRLKGGKVE